MIKFKKLSILILVLPLVISSVLLATCFCPQAQASVADQAAIQSNHKCCPNSQMNNLLKVGTVLTSNNNINESQGCCSDTLQPASSSILGDFAFYQLALSQKASSGLLSATESIASAISDFPTSNFQLSDFKLSQQSIFLKNETLRI